MELKAERYYFYLLEQPSIITWGKQTVVVCEKAIPIKYIKSF